MADVHSFFRPLPPCRRAHSQQITTTSSTSTKPPKPTRKRKIREEDGQDVDITENPEARRPTGRSNFATRIIDKSLVTQNPTVRVVKKYSRFDSVARERGWNQFPKSSDNDKFEVYDITSAGNMSADLSPMYLRAGSTSTTPNTTIEDAWQGQKVWMAHLVKGAYFDPRAKWQWKLPVPSKDHQREYWLPSETGWKYQWYRWRDNILHNMGKSQRHRMKDYSLTAPNPNVPLFSYYENRKMQYVTARKSMYVPWYANMVSMTRSFLYLQRRFNAGISLILMDPDGQPREEHPWESITTFSATRRINDPTTIFGHGLVLACVIRGVDVWSSNTIDPVGQRGMITNSNSQTTKFVQDINSQPVKPESWAIWSYHMPTKEYHSATRETVTDFMSDDKNWRLEWRCDNSTQNEADLIKRKIVKIHRQRHVDTNGLAIFATRIGRPVYEFGHTDCNGLFVRDPVSVGEDGWLPWYPEHCTELLYHLSVASASTRVAMRTLNINNADYQRDSEDDIGDYGAKLPLTSSSSSSSSH